MIAGDKFTHELSTAHIAQSMETEIAARARAFHADRGVLPTLAILADNFRDGTPTKSYINLKTRVGSKLGISVIQDISPTPETLEERIAHYNGQQTVHAMILQVPFESLALDSAEAQKARTTELLNAVRPERDVDGLGHESGFVPATPLAISSILEGNDIDYRDQLVVVRGLGQLVGGPLVPLLHSRGARFVEGIDADTPLDKAEALLNAAKIIITATGKAGSLRPDIFKNTDPRVIVDAGTAEQSGQVVGDVSDDLRSMGREYGWTLTPKKSGVGTLTVRHLLSQAVTAAEQSEPITEFPLRPDFRFYFQSDFRKAG